MRGAVLVAQGARRRARSRGQEPRRAAPESRARGSEALPGPHGTAPPDQDVPSFLPCRISALLRRPPAGAASTARPGILPRPGPLTSVPSSDRGPRPSRIAQVVDKEDLP